MKKWQNKMKKKKQAIKERKKNKTNKQTKNKHKERQGKKSKEEWSMYTGCLTEVYKNGSELACMLTIVIQYNITSEYGSFAGKGMYSIIYIHPYIHPSTQSCPLFTV